MRSKPVEVRLDPEDNQRLARLCGSLDENLRQIESALDVTIARRGAKFTVRGEQAQRAAQAIEHFYDRASGELTLDDVQLALTEVLQGNRPPPEAGPQLLTRRQDLHGRTPHQIEYIEKILAHDCTIGIGPAGTGKTYLAVACAVDALERDKVKRIVLVRPAVEAGARLGVLPGAQAVVNGDSTQIDLGRGQKSGLIEARRILAGVRGIAFTQFGAQDVVRHPLVARIIDAYEKHTQED